MKNDSNNKEISIEDLRKKLEGSDVPGGLLCCPPDYMRGKDNQEDPSQDEDYYVVYHAIYQTKDINKARWHVASYCDTQGMETMIKRKKIDGLTEF